MNRLVSLLIVGGVVVSAATAFAGEPSFFGPLSKRSMTAARAAPALFTPFLTLAQNELPPAPAADGEAAPSPMPAGDVRSGDPAQLFPCVKYEDLDNVHPCAVKKIVQVTDPCYDPHSCCAPSCVFVEICVPPCGCPKVKCSKDGRKVEYDYGDYEIEIKSKHGKVTVNYDD